MLDTCQVGSGPAGCHGFVHDEASVWRDWPWDYHYTVVVDHGRMEGTRHGRGCLAITGYTIAELEADPGLWYRMILEADRASVLRHVEDALAGKNPPPLEHRITHKNGSLLWVRNSLYVRFDAQGHLVGYDGMVSDVTELKQKDAHLRRYEMQLREITCQLSSAEARERSELAAALHDDVLQTLAVAKMKVDSALNEPERVTERLENVRGLLLQAMHRCRTLSFECSPPIFEEHGLFVAARWLAQTMRYETGLDIRLREIGNLTTPPPEALGVLLYRSGRELLINAIKHSRAASIRLTIANTRGAIWLSVVDRGVGFDAAVLDEANSQHGFGLAKMRERIRHVGGTWGLRSRPRKGTRITLRVPFMPPSMTAAARAWEHP